MASGIKSGLVCCKILRSDHMREKLLSTFGYFACGFGLEDGVEERGVDVRDEVCEVGLGSRACVEQCLESVVL